MRVVSKMLTADVRIVSVRLEGRKVVVEGMVKEIMPMTVEMQPADLAPFFRAVAAPLREKLEGRLPGPLARLLVR